MQPQSVVVTGALATILHLSRFAGIAPLRFEKKRNGWCISLSPCLIFFGRAILSVTGLLYIWRITNEVVVKNPPLGQNKLWARVHEAVWNTEDISVGVLTAMMVYGAPEQMRCLIPSLKEIEEVNCALDVQDWSIHWTKKQVTFFVIWVIVLIIVSVGDNTVLKLVESPTKEKKREQRKDSNERLSSLTGTGVKAFNPSKRINNYIIDSKFNSTTIAPGKDIKPVPDHSMVRCAADAYARTINVVRDMNRAHGPVQLMMLASLFLHLVLSYYYCITKMKTQTPINVYYELVFVMWCLVHTISLTLVIEPCHLTHLEMETTRVLVSRLMQRTSSPYSSLAVELDNFYKYLVLNEVSYNPLKVAVISRRLLISILANVTTYLVVLVQIK